MKYAYVTYGIKLRLTIYKILESKKDKRIRKENKDCLNKQWLELPNSG